MYAPSIGAPQYIRQTLTDIKGEMDSNTIILGDFNTPLTPVDTSSKQKVNKDTLDDMDLIECIFRTVHQNAEGYTFFSSAYGTFSRKDQILGHKSSLSKFKKAEIISSIFRPQHYETGYQLQEKNYKKCKHMEIKQHVSK